MTQGTKFGRRNDQGASGTTITKRAARAQQPLQEPEALVQGEAAPQVDPIEKALQFSAGAVAVVVACLVGAWTMLPLTTPVAPSANQQIDRQDDPGQAAQDSSAGTADDQDIMQATTPSDATDRDTVDAGRPRVKQATSAGNEQQRTAALKFFGFYHLAGRARAEYCATLGVDMAGFTGKLRRSQSAYHARATQVARAAGLTEEKIYADSRAELTSLVANDMEKIGSQTGMGPAGGCQMMAVQADMLLSNIDFSKLMPDDHRVLMGL